MLLMVIELLALTLFVAGIFANHHHVSVATDDLALVANLFDARANLHNFSPAGLVPRLPGPFLLSESPYL